MLKNCFLKNSIIRHLRILLNRLLFILNQVFGVYIKDLKSNLFKMFINSKNIEIRVHGPIGPQVINMGKRR